MSQSLSAASSSSVSNYSFLNADQAEEGRQQEEAFNWFLSARASAPPAPVAGRKLAIISKQSGKLITVPVSEGGLRLQEHEAILDWEIIGRELPLLDGIEEPEEFAENLMNCHSIAAWIKMQNELLQSDEESRSIILHSIKNNLIKLLEDKVAGYADYINDEDKVSKVALEALHKVKADDRIINSLTFERAQTIVREEIAMGILQAVTAVANEQCPLVINSKPIGIKECIANELRPAILDQLEMRPLANKQFFIEIMTLIYETSERYQKDVKLDVSQQLSFYNDVLELIFKDNDQSIHAVLLWFALFYMGVEASAKNMDDFIRLFGPFLVQDDVSLKERERQRRGRIDFCIEECLPSKWQEFYAEASSWDPIEKWCFWIVLEQEHPLSLAKNEFIVSYKKLFIPDVKWKPPVNTSAQREFG